MLDSLIQRGGLAFRRHTQLVGQDAAARSILVQGGTALAGQDECAHHLAMGGYVIHRRRIGLTALMAALTAIASVAAAPLAAEDGGRFHATFTQTFTPLGCSSDTR